MSEDHQSDKLPVNNSLVLQLILSYLLVCATLAAGWITHVVWAFRQETWVEVGLGLFVAIVAPVGALHGIYQWFI